MLPNFCSYSQNYLDTFLYQSHSCINHKEVKLCTHPHNYLQELCFDFLVPYFLIFPMALFPQPSFHRPFFFLFGPSIKSLQSSSHSPPFTREGIKSYLCLPVSYDAPAVLTQRAVRLVRCFLCIAGATRGLRALVLVRITWHGPTSGSCRPTAAAIYFWPSQAVTFL